MNSIPPSSQLFQIPSTHLRFFGFSKELESDKAWHGAMNESEAASLLRGQPRYSYLFRKDDTLGQYVVSYIDCGNKIGHAVFHYRPSDKYYIFQNGCIHYVSFPMEVVTYVLNCQYTECHPIFSEVN